MDGFFFDGEIAPVVLAEGQMSRKVKAYGGGLMMVENYFENGAEGHRHAHPHEQTVYCLEGEFEFTMGQETRVLKPGDTVYVPGDLEHGCKLLGAKGRLLDVFTPIRQDFLEKM